MDDTVAPVARRWELGVPWRTSPGSYRIHMDSPFFAELIGVFFGGGIFFQHVPTI